MSFTTAALPIVDVGGNIGRRAQGLRVVNERQLAPR